MKITIDKVILNVLFISNIAYFRTLIQLPKLHMMELEDECEY
jgi:hypothetical protein